MINGQKMQRTGVEQKGDGQNFLPKCDNTGLPNTNKNKKGAHKNDRKLLCELK